MLETLRKEWQAKVAVIIFIVYALLWASLQFPQTRNELILNFYEQTYGFMALFGGICGLFVAKSWGFFKSLMGKSIIFFSLGLLAQVFGQISYSYYVYFLHIEVPYPSIGDIGYFGSVFLYILAVYFLAKAAGVKIGLKSIENKIIAIIIPAVLLVGGYFLFLTGYDYSSVGPLQMFLDFGYPLGQAIYISMALLTYLLSRGYLGGVMKNKIVFLLFALFAQFISDYVFLYKVSRGTWELGGITEFLYLLAYFLMALGIIQLKTVANKLRQST